MATITLESVPAELLAQLDQRAARLGISLNEYMLRVCAHGAERQLSDDALDCLTSLPAYPTARIVSP
jgi:hypothetical protein